MLRPDLPARLSRTYRRDGHTVLELSGSIDIAALPEVIPHLDAATAMPRPRVVIDLTPVEFFDCSGVRLLVRARRRVAERGGRLALVCPHRPILRTLTVLRLNDTFRPAPTFDAALERIMSAPGCGAGT
ncbi:anti-sigma factor antagonist [Streptomyces sp. ODS28]|uniref:anti-sigma factor antagonist n=1 Tax=Streptomyces sp. ODS28 TaxID=3136688 RepID=UPI0031E61A3D